MFAIFLGCLLWVESDLVVQSITIFTSGKIKRDNPVLDHPVSSVNDLADY